MHNLRLVMTVVLGLTLGAHARAAEPIRVSTWRPAIDLTEAIELRQAEDVLRVPVATAFGATRRIEIRAREAGGAFAVFALENNGDEQLERLIVAPRRDPIDLGWPRFSSPALLNLTSSGERPERLERSEADVFRIYLDPGTVTTVVAELPKDASPRIMLWDPDAYTEALRRRQLQNRNWAAAAILLALAFSGLLLVKGRGKPD